MDCGKKGFWYKSLLAICVIVTVLGFVFVGYLCPERVCAFNGLTYSQDRYQSWSKLNLKHITSDNMGKPVSFLSHPLDSLGSGNVDSRNKLSFDDMVKEDFEFDIKGSDVMVFLHIQKTGGTAFGRHLVRDLDLEQPCKCKKGRKKCRCMRPDSDGSFWLFSRYSTGWKCGLHADWVELTNCVDSAMDQQEKSSSKRRYFYVTLLREPVARFLSEFRHVKRGATWKTSRHWCGGRNANSEELPSCFQGPNWADVTLSEFMSCKHNLAINRQTRMLADLTLVGCYNSTTMSFKDREIVMLASAKENLRKMAFFGLCENQRISQYLFESTFNLHFLKPFAQLNETHSSLALSEISPEELQSIRKLNHLDTQLYDFARNLLMERFEKLKREDPNFLNDFNNLGKRKKNHIESLFGSGSKENFP